MKDDLILVDELIRQDKIDRENDEILRLVKIYVDNRLRALEHYDSLPPDRGRQALMKFVRNDLRRNIKAIARSLRGGHPLTHMMFSFADNLEQIWFLPDAIAMVRRMHRELDPRCDVRSIVPAAPELSWRDIRYSGSLRA